MGELKGIAAARKRIMMNEPGIETVISGNTADSDYIAHFKSDLVAPIKQAIVHFEPVISGSGDASPSNVRAISGRSSITMTACGINMLNPSNFSSGAQQTSSGLTYTPTVDSNGYLTKVHIQGTTSAANAFRNLNYIGKMQFPFSRFSTNSYSNSMGIFSTGPSSGIVPEGQTTWRPNPSSWLIYDLRQGLSQGYCWQRFQETTYTSGTAINTDAYPLACLYSDFNCDYEPYKGTTYTMNLGNTYYGGSVDFTNGYFVEEYKFITFTGASSEAWNVESTSAGTNFYISISDALNVNEDGYDVCCNMAKSRSASETYAQGSCYISQSRNFNIAIGDAISVTTVADFKTWLSTHNLQLAYKVLQPVVHTMTPQAINTLRGVNNVWSMEGLVEIKYWTHRQINRPQKTIGGVPVYYDNVYYKNANGKKEATMYNHPDFFIAGVFDSGSTDKKSYTFATVPTTVNTGARFYNDLTATSADYWTISQSASTRTFSSVGRYILCPVYKPNAANFYIYDNTNGRYLIKGENIT